MSDEKINIDLLINTAESATKVKDVKKAVKDIKSALNEIGDSGDKNFLKLAQAAGELNEKMTKTSEAVKVLSSNAAKMGAIAGVGKKIAAGFEGATAASALFGKKSEDIEKTLLKVQAAASMTRAIGEFAEFGKAGQQAGLVIEAAFDANPIGVVIVALAAVAAIGATIYNNYFSATAKAEEELEVQKKIVTAAKEHLDFTNKLDDGLKKAGMSEEAILKYKIKQTKIVNELMKKELQKAIFVKETTKQQAIHNKELTQNLIRFISAPITIMLKTIDLLSEGMVKLGIMEKSLNLEEKFSGGIAGMIFNPDKVDEEGEKTIKEATKQLQEGQLKVMEYEGKIDDIHDKANEERKKKGEAAKQELEKLEAEAEKARLKIIADGLKAQEKYDEQEIKNTEKLIEKVKGLKIDALTDEKEVLRLKEEANLKSLEDEYNATNQSSEAYQAYIDGKLAIETKFGTDLKDLKQKEADEAKKLQDEKDKKELDAAKAISDAKLAIATDTVSSLTSLTNIMGQNSSDAVAIQKGLAVAQIGIDTAKAISAVIPAAMENPENGETMGIAGAVQMADGIASVLTNVAKATQLLSAVPGGGSVKMPSTGGGSGGGSGGVSSQSHYIGDPRLQHIGGQSGFNNPLAPKAGGNQGQGQQIIKAIVVDKDMSNQQNKSATIARRANLK